MKVRLLRTESLLFMSLGLQAPGFALPSARLWLPVRRFRIPQGPRISGNLHSFPGSSGPFSVFGYL